MLLTLTLLSLKIKTKLDRKTMFFCPSLLEQITKLFFPTKFLFLTLKGLTNDLINKKYYYHAFYKKLSLSL